MTTGRLALRRSRPVPGLALRRAGLGFGLAFLAVLIFGAAFLAGLAFVYRGRIMPGVSVAGVDLAGLDRPAAEARLQRALPRLDQGWLTLQVGVQVSRVSYASLDRHYDLPAMLDAAFSVGRGADPLEAAAGELRTLARGSQVVATASYDDGLLKQRVGGAVRALEVPAISARVVLDAASGTFTATSAVSGRTIHPQAVMAEVEARLRQADPADLTMVLSPSVAQPAVSTATAQAAAARADALTAQPVTLRLGSEAMPLPRSTLAGWLDVSLGPNGHYEVVFDRQRIATSLTELAGSTDRAVRDATLTWTLKGVSVVPAVEGRQLDVAASTATLAQALGAGGPAPPTLPASVDLSLTTQQPKVSTAEATAAASKLQLLSTWTTYFVPGEGNFWGRNISIPTSQIDRTVVAPGAWFDFWDVVRVSTALGYGPGGAIIGGHTQETGALGGGICSCSTTLFNAALRAGLQIGARMNHYYYISRYPKGLDATVYKSDGGWSQTMSFRNDTPYPILIRGVNGPGRVTFQLYGVPTGRRVVLSAPTIKNLHQATDTVQYTTSLRPGVKERVEWPADGFDAWVTRTVYDAHGAVIHHETFYSHYATITGLTLIGRAASAMPSPSPSPSPNPSPSPTPKPSPSPNPTPAPSPTPKPTP